MPPRRCFFLSALAIAVCLVIPGAAQAMAFSYTGGEQTYTVPAGVLAVSITAIGGPGGGPSGGLPGGRAAEVSGIVSVTSGEVLYVEVGGGGSLPAGGFNGGGDGASGGGLSVYGGGGASDVRTLPMSDGTSSLASRLIVAAGGGGSAAPAASGGDAGMPGGVNPAGAAAAGGAGTQSSGGAAGCGLPGVGCGTAGALGLGGAGGIAGAGADQREGGGGGGGLYGGGGGGGGGGGAPGGAVGGGGGGSSLLPSGVGTISLASLTTAPSVSITPIPPPTCQGVSSSTPFGKPVLVQLMCADSAGQPLSYAIMSVPAHGRLGAVRATGQVTYTPAVGFSGTDSFTYDASSPSGTSSVQTVSITVAANPVGVARAGRARTSKAGAQVRVNCTGAPGAHCQLTVAMTVTETFAGTKLVAVSSAGSKRHKRTRTVVTVGRASVPMRAGTSQVIRIRLNGVGKHLLSALGKLPVSIVVTQTAQSTKILVSHQTLTLKPSPRSHNKTH